MSLATASCCLWQNEQRNPSSLPLRGFTQVSLKLFRGEELTLSSLSSVQNANDVGLLRHWSVTGGDSRTCGTTLLVLVDDVIHKAVLLGLVRVHDEIALHIFLDLFKGLPGVQCHDAVQVLAHAQDLTGVDVDVGRLSAQATHVRLVDEDARVRQREALALGACAEQHGGKARRL